MPSPKIIQDQNARVPSPVCMHPSLSQPIKDITTNNYHLTMGNQHSHQSRRPHGNIARAKDLDTDTSTLQQPYTPKINNHCPLKTHQKIFPEMISSCPSSPSPSLTETSRSFGSPGGSGTNIFSSPEISPTGVTKTANNEEVEPDTRSVRFSASCSEATVDASASYRALGSSIGSISTVATTSTCASVKASCLHENLMRCQTRDPLVIYDLISVVGEGSMVRTIEKSVCVNVLSASHHYSPCFFYRRDPCVE